MKKLYKVVFATAVLIIIASAATAQINDLQEMTMVIPAESLAKVVKSLLPYEIDLGRNFVGRFFVQSIENIRIEKDRILFSSLISGKDIKYATKIGKQVVNFVVGDVNLPSQWEVFYNYDKRKKILMVKPFIKGPDDQKGLSQGDALLNGLLEAFSGIEYPVELSNLKPVTSEVYHQLLTLNADVADVYGAGNKLFVELIPLVQLDGTKRK
jgi:hypothetical protein